MADLHWHYAQLELVPEDLMARSQLSLPVSTRKGAHRQVEGLLDRFGKQVPRAKQLAETWRRGAKDDWVAYGLFQWTIYECTGTTCRDSAQGFLEDWAETTRDAGLSWVQTPKLPDNWPEAHREG